MDHRCDTWAPDRLGLAFPGDYHVHTTFSDGAGGVAECVEQAIAVGFTEIGISDHVSAVQPSPWGMPTVPCARLDRYVAEVQDVASRYDEIKVLLGVEADYAPEHEEQLRALLDAWPLDYVIGGVHSVDGFDFDDPARRQDVRWSDTDALFAAYYRAVRRAAEFGRFDVIAHLDYIGLWGHVPSLAMSDAICSSLDAIAASGAAIELNTDRLSDPAGVMYPSDELLRTASVRGIPLVISSDAHTPEHVGRLWSEAINRAAGAGFGETLRLSDHTLVPLSQVSSSLNCRSSRRGAAPD